MTDSAAGKAPAETGQATGHAERLYVPWYWWLPPLLAAGLLAAEIHMGYPGVRAWLPYLLLLPLTAVLIWRAGRAPVRIEAGELYVGTAHLPLEHTGTVEVFGAKEKRKVLGARLNPTAYVLHRGWVGPTVRVEITDPRDPTPYWVFSTRHPEKITSLLRA